MTLSDVRDTQIPEVLRLCTTDTAKLPRYLNEAVMRLLPKGQWRGTVARYKFCTIAACLTFPRQIETALGFSICRAPGTIRSHWYEFLDFGVGQLSHDDCAADQLIDRGTACAFDDIATIGNKIKIYADLAVDAGKTILLQGYDSNANWVLTSNGDVNGERVTIGAAPVTTSTAWLKGGLAAVQKVATKGPIRLYDYNPTTGVQRPIAIYEPDETVPEYRRYMVPGMGDHSSCCGSTTDCGTKTVTVLAKLAFIPVRNDSDYILIGNVPALKDMCMSILKREQNLIQEAFAYEASAVKLLDEELSNYYGDGTVDPIRSINAGVFGYAGVTSIV
ncbi:MAG: hypothetical protein H0U18_17755 [Pyrinomonadaceae bacterium]|nr:hypothetical protein [Pyrinomonadaceae bacterium]